MNKEIDDLRDVIGASTPTTKGLIFNLNDIKKKFIKATLIPAKDKF